MIAAVYNFKLKEQLRLSQEAYRLFPAAMTRPLTAIALAAALTVDKLSHHCDAMPQRGRAFSLTNLHLEVGIYLATVIGIVVTNLLVGVVIGLSLALLKLLYTFAHLEVRLHGEQATRTTTVALNGSATFVKLPQLAAALESIPPGMNVKFDIDRLSYIDHACLDLIANWRKQHLAREGQVELPWDDLQRRYHERNAAVFNEPTPPVIMPPKAVTAGGGK